MANLDDLIERVPDAALRRDLQAAAAQLRRRQTFGLVFEEHIPETTALADVPVRVGSLVQRRRDLEGGALFRVRSISGRAALLDPTDENDQPRPGEPERLPIGDLLVVKRFGEPIYPLLRSVGQIAMGGRDRPSHAVINGENFHALQLLVHLLERRVDCIYIDPPYNTGARDWKYNNNFVDVSDTWRHSKWLSMMHKRLKLAKRLLKPDGVLIVTVDEHEVHNLGLLLERKDLFPDPDYLRQMVTIVINPKGTGKLNFSRVDEHAIFVMPNLGRSLIIDRPVGIKVRVSDPEKGASLWDELEDEDDVIPDEVPAAAGPAVPIEEIEWRHARRRGAESSYRHQRPNQFYPIYVEETAQRVVRAGPSIPLDTKPNLRRVQGLLPLWPIDKNGDERCWRFVPESMQRFIDAGRVRASLRRGTWTLNYAVSRSTTRKWKTVWWETSHDAGTHGTEVLRKLLGKPGLFPFPKSIYAVRDCLAAVVANRPEALILDFFAGSGTTLHSTALLNAADDGHRQCILITNNEVQEDTARRLYGEGKYRGEPDYESRGVFEQVTRPRCEAVVRGTRADGTKLPGELAGFQENLEFFTLGYADPDDVDLGRHDDALLPLVWLAAGAVGPRDRKKKVPFSMPDGAHYAVLFDERHFRSFAAALQNQPAVTHVWLITDSEAAYAEMSSRLPPRVRSSMLYRDYLRSFRLNVDHFA